MTSSSHRFRQTLMPLVRRLRTRALLQGAGLGMLAGSLAAAAMVGVFTLGSIGWTLPFAAGLLALGPLGGLIAGWMVRPRPAAVARALDRQYQLDGRLADGLRFASLASPTRAQSLQLAEAERLLAEIDPRDVVPQVAPAIWHAGLAMAAAAATMLGLAIVCGDRTPVAAETMPAAPAPAAASPTKQATVHWTPAPAGHLPAAPPRPEVPTEPGEPLKTPDAPARNLIPTIPPQSAPAVRRYVELLQQPEE